MTLNDILTRQQFRTLGGCRVVPSVRTMRVNVCEASTKRVTVGWLLTWSGVFDVGRAGPQGAPSDWRRQGTCFNDLNVPMGTPTTTTKNHVGGRTVNTLSITTPTADSPDPGHRDFLSPERTLVLILPVLEVIRKYSVRKDSVLKNLRTNLQI